VEADLITMDIEDTRVGSTRENIRSRGEWCHCIGRKEDDDFSFVDCVTARLLLGLRVLLVIELLPLLTKLL
jgi:hypothetical protein